MQQIDKTIQIVCARNLALAGRLQKIISSFQDLGMKVFVHDFSTVNNTVYAKSLDIGYKYYNIKVFKSQLLNLLRTLWSNIRVGLNRDKQFENSYVLCHDLHTLIAGALLTKRSKTKLIYDASELAVERYSGLKKAFWSTSLNLLLPSCDKIIHTNMERQDYFNKKHHISNEKCVIIRNYPNTASVATKKNCDNPYRVLYFGTVIKNRSYEQLIEVFQDLPEPYGLDIIGYVNPRYRDQISHLVDGERVRLLPPVKQNEIADTLKQYKIGMIFYEPINLNNYYCAPNKVYEYVQNKMAIITNDIPFLRNFVDKYGVGVSLEAINSISIKTAIDYIVDNNVSDNISENVMNEFVWEQQLPQIRTLVF